MTKTISNQISNLRKSNSIASRAERFALLNGPTTCSLTSGAKIRGAKTRDANGSETAKRTPPPVVGQMMAVERTLSDSSSLAKFNDRIQYPARFETSLVAGHIGRAAGTSR